MELRITPRGQARSWRLWPTQEDIPAGIVSESATHVLDLVGVGSPDDSEVRMDGMRLKALRNPNSTTARWEWDVGFHAGTAEIEIIDETHRTYRAEVTLDPDQRKLTRESFETMVFETFEDMHAICALSPVRIGFDRGTHRPSLAKVEFFRSRFEHLMKAIRIIAAAPHRHLEVTERTLPIQRLSRITPLELMRGLRRPPYIKASNARISPQLRDHLPSRVPVRQRRSAVDNPENRAVRSCLRRWRDWLERAAKSFEPKTHSGESEDAGIQRVWVRRCRTMSRSLDRVLSESFFMEIGDGDERAADGSAIFRSVAGYQQFSRIRRDLGYGLSGVAGNWLDMPLAQTWRIYELWAFWKLARAATLLTGTSTVVVHGLKKDKDGTIRSTANGELAMGIDAGRGLQILFQRRYAEYWVDRGRTGTFSREMIPDVAIVVGPPGQEGLIVLDAKYRVESALSEALTSIHTYRDALVQETATETPARIVKGAYMVTPHVPGCIGADWKSEPMPNRLFHPHYRGTFKFGAITLIPGHTTTEHARCILQHILDDSSVGISAG